MNYKKCEHCGEEIHIRSKKCPFCNQLVAEVEEKNEEEIEKEESIQEINENKEQGEVEENKAEGTNRIEPDKVAMNGETPHLVDFIATDKEPKDYVYKAEVRHSLEYTNPISNMVKVFISALCTLPMIGQLIGTFLGVFFSTYEDTDRRSFGRALIFLSVFMFVLYIAYFKYAIELISTVDINSLYESLGK